MCGLNVVCILVFFTFRFHTKEYPCVMVHKYAVSNEANEDTGMWIAKPVHNT